MKIKDFYKSVKQNILTEQVDIEKLPEKVQQTIKSETTKELIKSLSKYRHAMDIMACDAPISVLCLPKVIESILINQGYDRVYTLLNLDFTKIKGFGEIRCRKLATRLNEFLSIR